MSVFTIGEKYRAVLEEPLNGFGVKILWLPDNPDVSPYLAGHADLSVFCADTLAFANECDAETGAESVNAGNAEDRESCSELKSTQGIYGRSRTKEISTVFLAGYLCGTGVERELLRYGCATELIDEIKTAGYPGDVPLNIRVCGNRVFANRKTASAQVLRQLESTGRKIIDVKQGYPACAALACGGDAVISADPGICVAAESAGLSVLRIQPGYIDLPGYDYGFIGGCAFSPEPGVMAFTGSLKRHPDGERIANFLKTRGIEIVQMTERPLFDIGGAVRINLPKGTSDED